MGKKVSTLALYDLSKAVEEEKLLSQKREEQLKKMMEKATAKKAK